MKKIMILSVLIMIPNWAVAGNSNIPHTHTNTPIELGFVSPDSSGIRVAAVCFLGQGDCGGGSFGKGDEDMSIDSGKRCINEGYDKTSCPLPAYLSDVCPYNEGYFAQCVEDKKRACDEAGFGDVACGVGEVADVACPYDSGYKKCQCNPCPGFTYSYAEATAQGYVSDGSCQSCAVVKYKRKENPCSGYRTCECGGEIGANVCYTGSMKKFSNCKSCIPPRASCAIGWIYYNDKTCSLDLENGKTALGVVVYVNPNGIGGQVMAAKNMRDVAWSNVREDIAGLPNYAWSSTASGDYDSCGNTDKIIAYEDGTNSVYRFTAAHLARSYNPTTETKGKWCLPAAGIITSVYDNSGVVHAGMCKLGGGSMSSYTWSSTESSHFLVWILYYDYSYGLGTNAKSNNFKSYVRPVLEF